MIFLVLLLYVVIASTFITGVFALQASQPFFLTGVRMLLSGSAMLLYALQNKNNHIKRQHLLAFLAMCLVHIAIPFGLEFWALQYVTPAKTALLWNLTPFITALYAFCMFQERMSVLKVVGLVIGFVGFFPVIYEQLPTEVGLRALGAVSTAELALLVAVASAAYAWILFKYLMQQGYSPSMINGFSMFGGGIISLVVSGYIEQWSPLPVSIWSQFIWSLVVLILTGSIISYNLYGYLLKRYSPTFLSFAGFLTPFFTLCMQLVVFGGSVTLGYGISLIAVTIGLYLFYSQELKEGIS